MEIWNQLGKTLDFVIRCIFLRWCSAQKIITISNNLIGEPGLAERGFVEEKLNTWTLIECYFFKKIMLLKQAMVRQQT